MIDCNIAIEQRPDVKDADLSKDLAMVEIWNNLTVVDEDPGFLDQYNRVISDGSIPNDKDNNETDDKEKENSYVNMDLGLPGKDDNGLMHKIVKRLKLNNEGKDVVNMNNNPLLGTRPQEVEFANGLTEFLTANIIAENLLEQVDEEGHRHLILDEIIDHRQDVNAIGTKDAFTKTPNGIKRRKMTTAGWKLCLQWKHGSTDWVSLKDIKQSYPVELEDYVKRLEFYVEPVFACWVSYSQKKGENI